MKYKCPSCKGEFNEFAKGNTSLFGNGFPLDLCPYCHFNFSELRRKRREKANSLKKIE